MSIDARNAALDYRWRLGWPAVAQGGVVWLAPGHVVEAVNLPRELGQRTVSSLTASGVAAPVIDVPGELARWVLLARPHGAPAGPVVDSLAGIDVGYAHGGPGSAWGIDLPPTHHPGHQPLVWVTPPDTPLPPLAVVVAAVLRASINRLFG